MPRNRFDTSKKYNRWTLISPAPRSARGDLRWHCRCDCGTEAVVMQRTLLSETSRSCGCLSIEVFTKCNAAHNRTHGESKSTPEYRAWLHMIARCYNQNVKRFEHHGGRGIRVCDRWHHSFENFLADMGRRPSASHSVDRRDNDGHYEPGNCRWATDKEQQNNKTNNFYVSVIGEKMSLRMACDHFGVEYKLVWGRIKHGWSLIDAMSLPRARNVSGMAKRPPPISSRYSIAEIREAMADATTLARAA